MHGTQEIIQEATALPVEELALVVDSLHRSLNTPDSDIEKEWIAVAQHRLADLRAGKAIEIPGSEVFARIRKRFAR